MEWDDLQEVEGRMDGEQYVGILNEGLLARMEESGVAEEDMIFQQDNDAKHTCKKATEWIDNEGMTVLEWAARSPDLNGIEHIWENDKKKLSGYDKPPSGVQELWRRVEIEWGDISVEECQILIGRMARRLEAVLKARGGDTKY